MEEIMKKALLVLSLVGLCGFGSGAFAGAKSDLNSENCVASRWTDANGNPISIDQQFGEGSLAVTRCLANTKHVKVLYQINTECKSSVCDAPYAVGNIINHIKDFEITHGMSTKNYDIVVIVHGAGWKLVLDNNALLRHAATNPFQAAMEDLVSRPSVNVYFCQNTAHSKNVKLENMIPGIGFVTSGVSSISDLQEEGYRYIQP